MKLNDSEFEESFFERSSTKVDKSVGMLVLGLVVTFFFSTFLYGITSIHSASSRVVGGDHSLNSPDEPLQEIGDTLDNLEVSISRTNN